MGIKQFIGKAKFFTKKNAPQILLVAGIAAEVGSIIFAVKGAAKSKTQIESAKWTMEDLDDNVACASYFEYLNEVRAKNGLETYDVLAIDNATKEKEKKKIIRRTTLSVVRNMAPAVALFAISTACRIGQYKILNNRLIATTIAYEALDQAYKRLDRTFEDYRSRVREKYSEEEDMKLYWGEDICPDGKNVHIKGVDADGNEVDFVTPVTNAEKGMPWYSIYAKKRKNDSYNADVEIQHIRAVQNLMNDRLSSIGYVFLSEVYEALGIPVDTQCVGIGWISKEHTLPGDDSDGYIDFGVLGDANRAKDPSIAAWQDGETNEVLFDFNVDGPIYHRLDAINKVREREEDLWKVDRAAYLRDRPIPYHV